MSGRYRLDRVVVAGLGLTLAVVLTGLPLTATAAAAGWAEFTDLTGRSGQFRTTLTQRAASFPAADVVTDSVGGSTVGVQTSAFLGGQTPVGQKYGSSRGEEYLSLRPSTTNGDSPSYTTYTFARPTPRSGWTFVLGDIDADQVSVTAVSADGTAVSPSQLGFRGTFNYCAAGVSPKPGCAPPNNSGTDLPSWDPATAVLLGDPEADDTAGASAWFEPSVALSSLSFSYARRAGSPQYQTWFSALAFDISGTVSAPSGEQQGVGVRLFDPEGTLVAATESDSDGRYSFAGQASYDGYRVAVVRPDGLTGVGPLSRTVDLSSADQTGVDFSLRATDPVAASGTVTDSQAGDPVAGVTVRLDGPDGVPTRTTTTDAQGSYLFDALPAGGGYEVTVEAPDGFTRDQEELTFDVPTDSDAAVTGLDFLVTPAPTGSVSGRVTTVNGDPVPGVELWLSGRGFTDVVTTDARGRYSRTGLHPENYQVAISVPDYTTLVSEEILRFTITPTGRGVTGQDFVITQPPAVVFSGSGTVRDDDGNAVAGVEVQVVRPDRPDGAFGDRTASDGTYRFPNLVPAEGYQLAVAAPSGYVVRGESRIVFDVTDRDVTGLDFILDRLSTPSPTTSAPSPGPPVTPPGGTPSSSTATPSPSTITPPGTTAPGITAPQTPRSAAAVPVATQDLADTGGPDPLLLGGAALLVVTGGLGLLLDRHRAARRRRPRHRG